MWFLRSAGNFDFSEFSIPCFKPSVFLVQLSLKLCIFISKLVYGISGLGQAYIHLLIFSLIVLNLFLCSLQFLFHSVDLPLHKAFLNKHLLSGFLAVCSVLTQLFIEIMKLPASVRSESIKTFRNQSLFAIFVQFFNHVENYQSFRLVFRVILLNLLKVVFQLPI